MTPRHLLLLTALVGCPAPADTDADTDTNADSDTADSDTDTTPVITRECDAAVMDGGTRTSSAPCSTVQSAGAGTQILVRADCTDPDITAVLDKPHVVVVPSTVTRDVLVVDLPGTSGTPMNNKLFLLAAARRGYRAIGLAYPNERGVGDQCMCPDGPRPVTCEELLRHEVVTGEDVTPWFDMEADEAIVPRLVALLQWLHAQRPSDGWDAFLDASGAPVWERIALAGFSQGGGMATKIAQLHEVDRVLNFSIIGGPAYEAHIDPSTLTPCEDDTPCAENGWCCPLDDPQCQAPPATGGYCWNVLPNPWVFAGADTDGDGLGDGDFTTRATPVDRHFIYVHTAETAWTYTPVTTETWGLGGPSDYVDLDTTAPPFAADARVFRTSAQPNQPGCGPHQSMGPDACLARDAQGDPVLEPGWIHALTVDVDP